MIMNNNITQSDFLNHCIYLIQIGNMEGMIKLENYFKENVDYGRFYIFLCNLDQSNLLIRQKMIELELNDNFVEWITLRD